VGWKSRVHWPCCSGHLVNSRSERGGATSSAHGVRSPACIRRPADSDALLSREVARARARGGCAHHRRPRARRVGAGRMRGRTRWPNSVPYCSKSMSGGAVRGSSKTSERGAPLKIRSEGLRADGYDVPPGRSPSAFHSPEAQPSQCGEESASEKRAGGSHRLLPTQFPRSLPSRHLWRLVVRMGVAGGSG
jgi:hypothetical protein